MPTSMILRRSEILAQIAAGKSNKWIARNYGHGRHLIREVRAALAADPSQIYVLDNAFGAPTKLRSTDTFSSSAQSRSRPAF
jgi:hypothetical protein